MRNKKGILSSAAVFIAAFASLFSVFSCSQKELSYNKENDKFIEAISPECIERVSPILISFTQEIECKAEEALSISPKVQGEWKSTDSRTFTFVPDKPFKGNKKLVLTADCSKLFASKGATGNYAHRFITTSPSYSVTFDELRLNEGDNSYSLSGLITTDAPEPLKAVQQILKAKVNGFWGKKCIIEWESIENSSARRFLIKNVFAGNKAKILSVSWKGKSIGLKGKADKRLRGKKIYNIPAIAQFGIVDINRTKKNSIIVSFSRPLDTKQDLSSLVTPMTKLSKIGSAAENVSITARDNVLTIFNDSDFENFSVLTIAKNLKSSDGTALGKESSIKLDEHWDLPEVRFLNDGNILPTSQGTSLPVETRNLTGLLVQAYAIYDHNMVQFLQENDFNGTSELYRVGEPVWENFVEWEWKDSMQNKYIARGLDLSPLVKKYPDGMFQIRISFRKKNVKYICRDNHRDFSQLPQPEDTIEKDRLPGEDSYWDYWDNLKYEDRETFWSYKNDPCHPAYYTPRYNSNSLIKRNVMVSDIGINAKRTTDGTLYVTTTDIKNAEPTSGIQVTLYSYVGSVINQAKTDSNGCAKFADASNVHFIRASSNGQSSYLKIADGTSLSTSHFQTDGIVSKDGIKGFIYGERDVWRPGDTQYLTFVLQDKEKKLPLDIPLIFELSDPLGRVTQTSTIKNGENGFYPIQAKTSESDVTGLWQAKVKIGAQEWTKALRVETVVPNRLAVKLSSPAKYLVPSGNKFTLSGEWLHGAKTPGYKADVSVTFSAASTGFDGYSAYSFTNPENSLDSKRDNIWSGHLDDNSEVSFSSNLNAGSNLPGKLRANFTSRIFEPSGAFSTEYKSMTYSPYERYVGLKLPKGDEARGMLLTDTDHTADVVLLTPDGKPVESASLDWAIYKLEWKWWWEKDALSSATYVSDNYHERIASGSTDVTKGRASFKFQVKYPDWGRYIVVVKDGSSGHSAAKIVYIDWPGWAGRAQEGSSGSAAMVTLVCDKQKYKTGETASISFATGADEHALVTIERNGKILSQSWLKTKEGTTVYKLPLTRDMAPNVYVHVTLLQKHLQTANSLPVRLYGIVPVMVEDPSSILEPQITVPEKYEPGKEAVVSVSEKNGKPMTYTLAVVDEGLLGLTNYHAPDIRSEFYKKEASQLLSWDIYSYIMNAYSGKLETLLAIGGGEDDEGNGKKDTGRFTPVVKYFGPFTLKAGEKKATKFTMPEYIGSVRAVVVAGYDGAYGTAEKKVPVKSDLMIQPVLPRTIGAGETLEIPVTVFNGMSSSRNVTVNAAAQGLSFDTSSKSVTVPAGENKTVSFRASVKNPGTAEFVFNASASNISAQSKVNVKVLSRGIPVTYKKYFEVGGGKTETVTVPSPSQKGTASLQVELSLLPALNLSERLSYLTEYPHGCIEQITSGGFPQLYLPSFIKLSDAQTDKVKANVESVIERYPQYQTASGGMGYWPGNTSPSMWGSCYALHFLCEAKKAGYKVPDSIYSPLLSWLEENEDRDGYGDEKDNEAYRLFVLSLANHANLGAMNRLADSSMNQGTRLLLAAAYAQSGRENVAKDLIKKFTMQDVFFRLTGGSFSSSIREQAIYLFTLNLIKDNRTASHAAKTVAENLSSDRWLSTQETAWSLLSLLPYYTGQESGKAEYKITANNKQTSGSMTKQTVIETLAASDESTQTAEIKNTGRKTLYGVLTAKGTSVPGTETAKNDGLSLIVSYVDSNGSTVYPGSLKHGDDFKINVRVTNTSGKTVENIALTVPLPTAWEINNDRIGGGESSSSTSFSYQDFKDEAVYTYFNLSSGSRIDLTFYATVAYDGSFYIPAVHAEAMYDDSIGAIIPGIYVEQKK
ncbi:MAG: alpha-2-macroglobulin [Treponema sp.]|nr:alpha-2-macroglobulin [Treponema sp.]MBQ1714004.1 alpha-2-macroglobulin [Treponema sp.]MBQ5450886.1 alpha-2-macroglobulin [Treponema sp.]